MDSQQQLRQRGAKNAAASAPADHSHSHSDDDDAHLFEAAHADAEPLVPAARSAFDGAERDAGNEISASSAAPAAPADLPGPASQSMDDVGTDSGALELDTSAAMGVDPASSGVANGSRLNLPPQLRAAFEQRRAELLAQHPDIMVSRRRRRAAVPAQNRTRSCRSWKTCTSELTGSSCIHRAHVCLRRIALRCDFCCCLSACRRAS